MREHTRAPARLTFFLFIYFHTEVRKAIRSMNLLSTFVFLLVFYVYVCTCTRVFRTCMCGFYNYFFSFVYCSVASLLLFHHLVLLFSFCPTIIRSLTFSLLDQFLPPFYLAFPVFLPFGSCIPSSPPPLISSHENYSEIRESKRDRGGIKRRDFSRIGWSEGSGEIIVYRRG